MYNNFITGGLGEGGGDILSALPHHTGHKEIYCCFWDDFVMRQTKTQNICQVVGENESLSRAYKTYVILIMILFLSPGRKGACFYELEFKF